MSRQSSVDALTAWAALVPATVKRYGRYHVELTAGSDGPIIVSRYSPESAEQAAEYVINTLHWLGIEVPR